MAKIPNTVAITGPVAPLDDRDIYGTHYSKYGIGGYYSIETYEELEEIPITRRSEGEPLVYVRSINRWYLYINNEWNLADFSNGSSCCLIIGIDEDGDDIVSVRCLPPPDSDPFWWMDNDEYVQNTVYT